MDNFEAYRWSTRQRSDSTERERRRARERYDLEVRQRYERAQTTYNSSLYDQSPYHWDIVFNDKIKEPVPITPTEYKLHSTLTNESISWGNSRQYHYKNNVETLVSIQQVPFPGCCGIAILRSMSMDSNMSQKEFNNFVDSLCEDLKENDRYGRIMIYTTTTEGCYPFWCNYPNITILDTFKNPRTERMLAGFEIIL